MPDFGVYSAAVMGIAVVSIIAVSSHTQRRFMPHYYTGQKQGSTKGQTERTYKKIIGRYPHKSMSMSDIEYVNGLYGKKV